jgi:hypothetical protein
VYYIHPEVRKRLGYTGQVPVKVPGNEEES